MQDVWAPSGTPAEVAVWPRLKRVYLYLACTGFDDECRLPLEALEELHIRVYPPRFGPLHPYFGLGSHALPELRNLQKLTIEHTSEFPRDSLRMLEGLVRPGLESGSLRELAPAAYLRDQPDWFKSDHVTFLGIHGLSLPIGTNRDAIDEAFLDLIGRFPHLVALDIANEPVSNGALGKAIRNGIKTVYYRGPYHERAEVRLWAEQHNCQFINGNYTSTLAMNSHLFP